MATESNGRTATMIAPPDAPDAPEETERPEQIAASDLAYHQRVLEERRAAEVRQAEAQAAQASWWRYLQATYGLGAGDQVALDGTILRATEQ